MGIRYEWCIVLVIHLYCLTPRLKILHSYWDVTFTRKRLQILGLSFSYYIWAGRDYFSWITCCDIGPWRLLARPKKRPIKIRCQTSHLKAWSNPLHEIGDFHCNWTSQTTNVTSYINFGPNVYLTEHRNYENQLIFYLHDHYRTHITYVSLFLRNHTVCFYLNELKPHQRDRSSYPIACIPHCWFCIFHLLNMIASILD